MSLNTTDIEWCINSDGSKGTTWNPVYGCAHMCYYCYAKDIDKRFYGGDFHPRLMEERLDDLDKAMTPKPRTIFVGSMSDLFGRWNIPDNLSKVMNKVLLNNEKRHDKGYRLNTFVFLTKDPTGYHHLNREILQSPNFWFGITLENFGADQDNLNRAKVFYQLSPETFNSFVSLEPLLEASIINDDLIRLLIEVKWLIFGVLNIKGKPTPPKGDANVGGIIDKLLAINPRLFLKDSVLKMEGMYWRTSMRDIFKKIRYVPWRV